LPQVGYQKSAPAGIRLGRFLFCMVTRNYMVDFVMGFMVEDFMEDFIMGFFIIIFFFIIFFFIIICLLVIFLAIMGFFIMGLPLMVEVCAMAGTTRVATAATARTWLINFME